MRVFPDGAEINRQKIVIFEGPPISLTITLLDVKHDGELESVEIFKIRSLAAEMKTLTLLILLRIDFFFHQSIQRYLFTPETFSKFDLEEVTNLVKFWKISKFSPSQRKKIFTKSAPYVQSSC